MSNPEDPTLFDSLISQGLAASQANETGQALRFFEQASELAPESGMPHFLIASELAAAGHMEAAEQAFARAVLLAPGFELARYQMGLLQLALQRTPQALLTWQPLLDLPPTEALGHFARGFTALAADRFQAAWEAFAAGLACESVNPGVIADVRQVMARIESELGGSPGTGAEAGQSHVLLSGYARSLH